MAFCQPLLSLQVSPNFIFVSVFDLESTIFADYYSISIGNFATPTLHRVQIHLGAPCRIDESVKKACKSV